MGILNCSYPALFTAAEEGGFVITFPDIPEAITQGEDMKDCIIQAMDALDEAIAGRLNRNEPIPRPSLPRIYTELIYLSHERSMQIVNEGRRE